MGLKLGDVVGLVLGDVDGFDVGVVVGKDVGEVVGLGVGSSRKKKTNMKPKSGVATDFPWITTPV